MNAIAEVQSALAEMPPESTFDDIMYKVYVLREIEKGLAASRAGDVISQEEAKRRFEEWRMSRGLAPH
jgi:predicted transcriptional regulator